MVQMMLTKGGFPMMKRLAAFALAAMLLLSLPARAESDLGILLTNALYRIVLRTEAGDTTLGSAALFADQKILLTADSCCVPGDLYAIGEDGEHRILVWEKANDSGIALMEMVTASSGTPLTLANYDAMSLPFIMGANEAGLLGSVPLYQALQTVYRGQEALVFRGDEGILPGGFVADEKGGIIGMVVAQQTEGVGMYIALDPDVIYMALTAKPDTSAFCPVTLSDEGGSVTIAWTDEERGAGHYAITISGDSNHFYNVIKAESAERSLEAILPPGHAYYIQVQWVAEGKDMVEPVWDAMNTIYLPTQPLTAHGFGQECYLTFGGPDQEGAITLPRTENITRAMLADDALVPYFQIRNTYDVDEEIRLPATVELLSPDGQFFFLDLTYVFDPTLETDDSFTLSMTELFSVCADFSGGALPSGEYVIRYHIGGEMAGEYRFTLEE